MNLIYNILFALLGFAAIILEFFVPSAGVIGLIGTGFVIAGIVYTFLNYGLLLGTIFLISCAIIGPTIIYFYFKLFPKSYIGKKLILDLDNKSIDDEFTPLLNLQGRTETVLRPAGYAIIEGKRYNVVTLGEYIEEGIDIEVINIEGNRIIVTKKELS